ncbi:hypothetical protein [Thiothrix subterranea]|uniref:hypothetical protein n=1 Tax=Thiothrix subterranea TaxID=2735563 RepID=UPI00280B232C|nr:hypothetical protein [Thiothrix subterranea]
MKYISALVGAVTVIGAIFIAQVSADESMNVSSRASVGKVVFLVGQAELQTDDGIVMPVSKGMDIHEGSRLTVHDRSQVGLSMIDGAS